jgi:hypothetical protein
MPRPPGLPKTGGRRKGVPNKLTSIAREAWGKAWTELAPEVCGWIRQVADGRPESDDGPGREPDPARAAELTLKLAEYHVPKVREPPVSVEAEGGKVTVVVQSYAAEAE